MCAVAVEVPIPDVPLVVLSSGNSCGVFEPCRCPTNPYGGIARRATLVNEYRKKYNALILLDSGNIFDSATSHLWGNLLTLAYHTCRYDAVALGSLDVMYARKVGAEEFRAMDLPWVCGNMETGREELGVVKYRILRRGKYKVGVTAFLEPYLVNQDVLREVSPPINLSNPGDVLPGLVEELRKRADVVCVLAHMERPQAEQLFKRTKGIDLFIMGHDKRLTALNGTNLFSSPVLVEVGRLGQYLAGC